MAESISSLGQIFPWKKKLSAINSASNEFLQGVAAQLLLPGSMSLGEVIKVTDIGMFSSIFSGKGC